MLNMFEKILFEKLKWILKIAMVILGSLIDRTSCEKSFYIRTMDWLFLVQQVLQREKSTGGVVLEDPKIDELKDLGKPKGNLSRLELAGILSILNILSLQLYVLHAKMPKSALQSKAASAKQLHGIIEKTITELKEFATFDSLYETVRQKLAKREADINLRKTIREKEEKIRHLRFQIRSNEKMKVKDINKKQEMIALLKDEVQNLIAVSESKMRYTVRWENAQQEKNHIRCENLEMAIKRELENLSENYNNEIAVNNQISVFLTLQIEMLQNDVKNWEKRYKEEIQLRTENITRLQNKAKEQQFRVQELKELYNDRQGEMEAYLKLKKRKRMEEERKKFFHDMATKIQAWWRGTMVRRGLGPYKKRKKMIRDKKNKKKIK